LKTEDIAGGNPLAEGLVYARSAAEMATLILVGLTAATHIREQRLQVHRGSDVDTNWAQIQASHSTARLAWAPGLEPEFARASTRQAAAVWVAAEPWSAYDPDAREAMHRAEERLARLYPEPMANYNQRHLLGADRFDAMAAVAGELQERARLGWAPGLEPEFANADSRQAAGVWVAAEPWSAYDPGATEAMHRAEDRLALLYPGPMASYNQRVSAGADRFDAMSAVAAQLRKPAPEPDSVHIVYDDRAPAGRYRTGVPTDHERLTEAAERAAALASQAFPQTIQRALSAGTALLPAATTALRLSRGRDSDEG
jgi:hypothetical protein